MTEDLQHLLDKIQKDGVDKAETESSRIIEAAKAKSDEIIRKANSEAIGLLEKAKKDAVAFEQNGRKSLEQAARDVIISARSGIQKAVAAVVSSEASKSMDENVLSMMLGKIVDAYCSASNSTSVLVNPQDVENFKKFILSKVSEKARQGITIVPEPSVTKGFKVVLKDKNIEHDLTDQAISEALSRILRPHIAKILEKAI